MLKTVLPHSQAAGAYAASQRLQTPQQPAKTESFAELLGRAVGGIAESGQQAEALTRQVATGQKPEFTAVVTAVAESEAALETLVAVRDKVIQAYEEILRMPI